MHSLLDSTHSKCKASVANQRRLTPYHVQHSLYCGPSCCEPYTTTQYRAQKVSQFFTRHRLRRKCSWASSGLVAATCSASLTAQPNRPGARLIGSCAFA